MTVIFLSSTASRDAKRETAHDSALAVAEAMGEIEKRETDP